MRLYLHFQENTIIVKWTEESGTLRDLRREFVFLYHKKFKEELPANDLVLTLGESSRPLDVDAKISKLFKDRDDIHVKIRGNLPTPVYKEAPAVVSIPQKQTATANVAVPATSAAPPTQSIYDDMPPLEPDVDDEYAQYWRTHKPPRGSNVTQTSPTTTAPQMPTKPTIVKDDVEQVLSPNASRSPNVSRTVSAPCSVCSEVLDFDERATIVPCKSCNTSNINLTMIDAQTDCGRCSRKMQRRRGDVTIKCECGNELVVVKCPKCQTPFVAPHHLAAMPCVGCQSPFAREAGLMVSQRQSLFFLANQDIAEPRDFKFRLKWKKAENPINLITQYYKDDSPDRQEEIDRCLEMNIANEYIDHIFLFTEDLNIQVPQRLRSDKIKIIRHGRRLKFKDAFDYCNIELEGQLCIVANSDIFFDHTLRYLLQWSIAGKFLALSRVDVTSGVGLNFNEWTAPVSQDAWIFKSPLPSDIDADFFFGWLGCDNRIAYELKAKGLHVINPSLKLICRHVHMTEKRNYTEENKVVGKYAAVPPVADF